MGAVLYIDKYGMVQRFNVIDAAVVKLFVSELRLPCVLYVAFKFYIKYRLASI